MSAHSEDGSKEPKRTLTLVIEGKEYEYYNQYITGLEVKKLAGLSNEDELFLNIREPWKDERILDETSVDLARPGIEQFFVKRKLKYTIDGSEFESNKQYIKGSQIREQGGIPIDSAIFLSIKGPWEDEEVKNNDWVNLARPGIEHFYSKAISHTVTIIVNGRPKPWDKDVISYKEVAVLAFGHYDDKPNMVYTVTYSKGPHQNPQGSMDKGDQVFVKDKMIFNATATDKS